MDRCALKDDIDYNKLDKSAFNELMVEKLNTDINENTTISSSVNLSNYESFNVKDLLTNVLLEQDDHSSNQIEEYEGEMYLPNLISEIGKEAPIQPLLYQNSSQGNERGEIRSFIIDSGFKVDNVTSLCTNLGNNPWYKFRVDLQDTLKIDTLSDIYLKNITINGVSITGINNSVYFAIDIDEFNIFKPSNNPNLNNKIVVPNVTNTVLNKSYSSKENYITSINPEKLNSLTVTITDEDGNNADLNGTKLFTNVGSQTNRVIIEIEFIPRIKQNEIIFDRTPYGSSLNAKLSNT